ncbi:hypothetical protein CFP56_037802 [Quercus suber]|uniref:Uncharacterized protein n=1 Tax=Quercus suber TaxID=58331 RepID=A0AAW0J4X1_QUESU
MRFRFAWSSLPEYSHPTSSCQSHEPLSILIRSRRESRANESYT